MSKCDPMAIAGKRSVAVGYEMTNNRVDKSGLLDSRLTKGGTNCRFLRKNCITVHRKTPFRILEKVTFRSDQKEDYPGNIPMAAIDVAVGREGNVVLENATVKVAKSKGLQFIRHAHCFDCEEDTFDSVENRDYSGDDMIVTGYGGPRGSFGGQEVQLGHAGSEAAMVMPIVFIRDVGVTSVTREAQSLGVDPWEVELRNLSTDRTFSEDPFKCGTLLKYNRLAPAFYRCGKGKEECYADV